jgi:hypothetical protein
VPHTLATPVSLHASWQVLFLDHHVESLEHCGPLLLGTMRRGLSTWSILPHSEILTYGGSSYRKLFGCTITLFDTSNAVPLSVPSSSGEDWKKATCEIGPDSTGNLFQQQLMTWAKVNPNVNFSVVMIRSFIHRLNDPISCRSANVAACTFGLIF